jgi:lauroyl/myristoyl acyltransferase
MKNNSTLMIASGAWIERAKPISKYGKGFFELRQLVKHLRAGGRVLIAADVFSDSKSCPAIFFEKSSNVSLTPARLARIAEVPLVTVVAKLEEGYINITEGTRFDHTDLNSCPDQVTRNILGYLENEIRQLPAIWYFFVRKPLAEKISDDAMGNPEWSRKIIAQKL